MILPAFVVENINNFSIFIGTVGVDANIDCLVLCLSYLNGVCLSSVRTALHISFRRKTIGGTLADHHLSSFFS